MGLGDGAVGAVGARGGGESDGRVRRTGRNTS